MCSSDLGVARTDLAFYELHIGTFTPDGTLDAATARLDHLASIGVTHVELLPVNGFNGQWNWGYDGVLPFAPDSSYGRPEDLKALVAANSDLTTACENCHKAYKPSLPTEGVVHQSPHSESHAHN